MTVKVCSKCGIAKDISEFGRHSKMKDGLQIWCKTCIKDYSKTYSSSIVVEDTAVKLCTKCITEKSIKEFPKDKYKKDGHGVICKQCNKNKVKVYQEENKARTAIPNLVFKKCSVCGIEKEPAEFREDKATKDGLYNYCKECSSLVGKTYHKKNRASILEKKRIYRLLNPDKIKAYAKSYYNQHTEEMKQKKKTYVLNNKEKIAETNRGYRKNNKDRIRQYQKIYNEEHKEEIARQSKLHRIIYYKENKEEIIRRVTKYTIERCKIDLEYKNKISAAWYVSRVLKPQILERDNYRCQLCGCQDTVSNRLECHHILPKSISPDRIEDMDNLVTLCRTCHLYKAHKGWHKLYDEKLAQKLLEQVKSRN